MRPSGKNKRVTLWKGPTRSGDADGYDEPLTPSTWWAEIKPLSPTLSDGTRIQASRVTIRYHPQVTVDCFIKHGTRTLFVKGVQNIDDANVQQVLFCEEVIP